MSESGIVHLPETDMLSRRLFLRLGAVLCSVGATALLGGCASPSEKNQPQAQDQTPGPGSELQEVTIFAFDTVVSLSAYCSEGLMRQVVARCHYFEERFSRTIAGSDVWNINNAAGMPVEVAEETADILMKSLEYGKRSGGLFDITIGAVSSLWDFGAAVKPADEDIQEAVRHVDYTGVSIDGTVVVLADPSAMIDLGGIAKGYIADDLARMLNEGGCTSAMINLGGNVFALGSKPDGSDWRVGIQDPHAPAGSSIVATASCSGASVVTSGLYERQFELDGQTYYHILDPQTGYPVVTDLISSSVMSASSLDGDVYSTWMFLLGRDKALELLRSAVGFEGMVIDREGEISMTENAEYILS